MIYNNVDENRNGEYYENGQLMIICNYNNWKNIKYMKMV